MQVFDQRVKNNQASAPGLPALPQTDGANWWFEPVGGRRQDEGVEPGP